MLGKKRVIESKQTSQGNLNKGLDVGACDVCHNYEGNKPHVTDEEGVLITCTNSISRVRARTNIENPKDCELNR